MGWIGWMGCWAQEKVAFFLSFTMERKGNGVLIIAIHRPAECVLIYCPFWPALKAVFFLQKGKLIQFKWRMPLSIND